MVYFSLHNVHIYKIEYRDFIIDVTPDKDKEVLFQPAYVMRSNHLLVKIRNKWTTDTKNL